MIYTPALGTKRAGSDYDPFEVSHDKKAKTLCGSIPFTRLRVAMVFLMLLLSRPPAFLYALLPVEDYTCLIECRHFRRLNYQNFQGGVPSSLTSMLLTTFVFFSLYY